MKIAVIGAGAIGSFFAAKLAPFSEVWMVSRWQAQVTTVNKLGLQLITPNDEKHVINLQATTNAQTLLKQCDIALITVKTPDTVYASKVSQVVLKPTGIALSLQNGLGNIEKMAQV